MGRYFREESLVNTGNEQRRLIEESVYQTQMIDSDTFTANMDCFLEKSVAVDSTHVLVTDGALQIQKWINEKYPKTEPILDFYHTIQRVAETLKEITSDPKQQQKLTKNTKNYYWKER